MPWNEPGGNKNPDRDPWGGGGKKNNTPPDLDALLRKLKNQLAAMLNGAKNGGAVPPTPPVRTAMFSLGWILAIIVGIYIAAGFFIVRPAERAVIFRFGKYTETLLPGPHWIPLFIESRRIVNVEQVLTSTHTGQMLTRDENIVVVEFTVQYKVGDLAAYLFNVISPKDSLQQATDSAIRQVIGHSTLDDILTTGRELIRQQVTAQLKTILARYNTGLVILNVAMQPAKAPEAVKAAFDDVTRAQEDQQREINQANAYKASRIPAAEGQVRRKLAEAEGYKQKVTLDAQGNVALFKQLLPQYDKAPDVTRTRLYLNAMQDVLSRVKKVMVDSNGTNNLFFPMDNKNLVTKPEDASTASIPSPVLAASGLSSVAPTTPTADPRTTTRPDRDSLLSRDRNRTTQEDN